MCFTRLLQSSGQTSSTGVCTCACVSVHVCAVCVCVCVCVCVRACLHTCEVNKVTIFGDCVPGHYPMLLRCGEKGQRREALQSAYSHMAGQPLPAVPVHNGEEADVGQFGHCPSQTARGCLVDPVSSLPAIGGSVGTTGGTTDSARWVGAGPGRLRGIIPLLYFVYT